jgi:hypothetical protein
MINCAHPTHFDRIFASREKWTDRIRGLRANASARSHAELDQATDLDDGDPDYLAINIGRFSRGCRGSLSWAAVAAPTIAMSRRLHIPAPGTRTARPAPPDNPCLAGQGSCSFFLRTGSCPYPAPPAIGGWNE